MKLTKASFLAVLLGSSSVAFANEAAAAVQPNPMGQWVMLLGFVAVFYFMIWRPQSQRQKAQTNMIAALERGDEIISSGGVLGRVSKVMDSFVLVEVANGVQLKLQKQAVSTVVPKGTYSAGND